VFNGLGKDILKDSRKWDAGGMGEEGCGRNGHGSDAKRCPNARQISHNGQSPNACRAFRILFHERRELTEKGPTIGHNHVCLHTTQGRKSKTKINARRECEMDQVEKVGVRDEVSGR
jgi:hypothetical protein